MNTVLKKRILLAIGLTICILILIAYNFSFFAKFWFTSTETAYYPNRQKRFERHNKCGIYDGIWEAWNEKGQIFFHKNYIMGKRNGEFLKFNDSTGLIEQKQYYNIDKLDSEIIYHHGIKATSCYYKIITADIKENTYLLWHDNGTISSKMIDKFREFQLTNKRISNIQIDYDSLENITSMSERYHKNENMDSVVYSDFGKDGNRLSVSIEKIYYKNGEEVCRKKINK